MPTIGHRRARTTGADVGGDVDRESGVPAAGGRAPGDWTWPPYAPVDAPITAFDTDRWAPPTCVRHPWVRVGRYTLLYRRAA